MLILEIKIHVKFKNKIKLKKKDSFERFGLKCS